MSLLDLVSGLPSRPSDLRTCASVTLSEAKHLDPIFCKALKIASETNDTDAMQLAYDLSCSGSGSEVGVSGPDAANVAILMLGYGGASVALLLAYAERAYAEMLPGARVVVTCASGLCAEELAKPSLEAQLKKVVASLEGCKQIVAHVCSNNGAGLWGVLQQRVGTALNDRLAAVVYDCAVEARERGVGGESEAAYTDWVVSWVLNSVWSGVMVHREKLVPGRIEDTADTLRALKETLEKCTRSLIHAKLQTRDFFWLTRMRFDAYGYLVAHEPSVPTLCLTSASDVVVPHDAVDDWASRLRSAKPSRPVSVETLSGAHVHLHETDTANYRAKVRELLLSAGVCKAGD
jgi:hypothetical protein